MYKSIFLPFSSYGDQSGALNGGSRSAQPAPHQLLGPSDQVARARRVVKIAVHVLAVGRAVNGVAAFTAQQGVAHTATGDDQVIVEIS